MTLKYLKIMRKIISSLQNNEKIKGTKSFNYEILIKFTLRNKKKKEQEKIKVLTEENCSSTTPLYTLIFSIPNDFDFNFVHEMLIPKKVLKRLVCLFLKRIILLCLLTTIKSLPVDIMSTTIEYLRNNLYGNEKKLDELFTKNSEILDRNDFKDIFEIIS